MSMEEMFIPPEKARLVCPAAGMWTKRKRAMGMTRVAWLIEVSRGGGG